MNMETKCVPFDSSISSKRQKVDQVFGKKTSSHFSLASDGTFGREESSEEENENEKPWKYSSHTLGQIFSLDHTNLTSIVFQLMTERKTKVYAQKGFMDVNYLDSGKFTNYEDLELYEIPMHMYCAIGYVEQAITAGLQIIYHFIKSSGKLNGLNETKDALLKMSHSKKKKYTRFDLSFKMNGYVVYLAISEANSESYISLCIDPD